MPWAQLGIGFYEQYTHASGVFAPEGLAYKAAMLLDTVLESVAATSEPLVEPIDNEGVVTAVAVDPLVGQSPSTTISTNTFSTQSFGHCSSGRAFSGHCR